jgi:hypothetical protein
MNVQNNQTTIEDVQAVVDEASCERQTTAARRNGEENAGEAQPETGERQQGKSEAAAVPEPEIDDELNIAEREGEE